MLIYGCVCVLLLWHVATAARHLHFAARSHSRLRGRPAQVERVAGALMHMQRAAATTKTPTISQASFWA